MNTGVTLASFLISGYIAVDKMLLKMTESSHKRSICPEPLALLGFNFRINEIISSFTIGICPIFSSKYSVICITHFEERFIINGKSRKTLNMKLNRVPSIHPEEVCKRPSTIPTAVIHRKLPKKRDFSINEMQDFKGNDTISSFEELNEKHSPPGFQFRKTDDWVLYYNLQFVEKRHFPRFLNVLGWIKNSMIWNDNKTCSIY